MLNNIPKLISPDLMKALMEMGHGDELIIADGNYPAHSQGVPVLRLDGQDVKSVLEAILQFFPLDQYSDKPIALMAVVPGDENQPHVWDSFKAIFEKKGVSDAAIDYMERFDFYKRSKKARLIIATSDLALYANILLKKGVVD